jgi:two-component system, response regulator FlrC
MMENLMEHSTLSAPSVLLVEDDEQLRFALHDTLQRAGYCVHAAQDGTTALNELQKHEVGLVLSDIRMPGMDGLRLLERVSCEHPNLPVMLMTAHGKVDSAVRAMRAGAVDFVEKPFKREDLLARIRRHVRPTELNCEPLVAKDEKMRALLSLVDRVATTSVTALVSGESGTGKEVIARRIHTRSTRSDKPFVALNCAAIPENLLESTLFGHERGAFTGAHQARQGKFEQADGGTLFLDEITEMHVDLQAKLLRVLQEREIERVGGTGSKPVDVRVIASTNRDLRAAVDAGRFREDLFYRLNVVPIIVPPLRARADDIGPLAEFLLSRHAKKMGRGTGVKFQPCAMARLHEHSWPGNVRELENVVQRALVLEHQDQLCADSILLDVVGEETSIGAALDLRNCAQGAADSESGSGLKAYEQRMILHSLQVHGGDRKLVAGQLAISPRTLRYKLARMRDAGIEIPGRDSR